jgi:uncharacterized protein YhbP (UPF0306 family)
MEKILTDAEVETIIRAYVPQVIHMSLGTVRNGKPWVCEVHYAYDDNLNLYFCSLPTTRHCQDIAANPQVAGNIVTQHFLNQTPRGVYFEGTAEAIEVDERHDAVRLMSNRLGKSIEQIMHDLETGRRFYKVTLTDLYLFDTYVSRPSRKYRLAWPQRRSM